MTNGHQGYAVRPPEPHDAAELGALHCEVWRAAYAGLMAPESLARLSPERFARGWEQRLAVTDADGHVADTGERVQVAVALDGALAGFISVGPAREDDGPTPRQLWALNVLPEHQGTGLAQRLLDEVLGPGPAYLWVARGNDRAIRFYERNGFVLDGVESADQHDGIVEVRMVRRAAAS